MQQTIRQQCGVLRQRANPKTGAGIKAGYVGNLWTSGDNSRLWCFSVYLDCPYYVLRANNIG